MDLIIASLLVSILSYFIYRYGSNGTNKYFKTIENAKPEEVVDNYMEYLMYGWSHIMIMFLGAISLFSTSILFMASLLQFILNYK